MKLTFKNLLPALLSLLMIIALILASAPLSAEYKETTIEVTPAPEFTQTHPAAWINSPPLRIADLKGKVVLLDVWTFGCWNCYRSFPWLTGLEKKLEGRDFTVIGIHTPEFDHEHERQRVVEKTQEFGLHHPVMMDNDFGYWKALNNRFWPAYYLIDKQGRLRGRFIGETHNGDRNARSIESAIRTLLAE